MNHATHPPQRSAPRALILATAALTTLTATIGCACNLKSTPMVIMQPTEPGAGRVVALHSIEPHDEHSDPSRLLGHRIDTIPPPIVELITQARLMHLNSTPDDGTERFTWECHTPTLRDWGGCIATLRIRPDPPDTGAIPQHTIRDRGDTPPEYAIWIERTGASEPPYWRRTTIRMPTSNARVSGVHHGFAIVSIRAQPSVDAVVDLNTDPPTQISIPRDLTLHSVSFRPGGAWVALSRDMVCFGSTRDGAMHIERSIPISPPKSPPLVESTGRIAPNTAIYLDANAQRALLHDFRIVARDGTVTEPAEPGKVFGACGTPSRAGIMPARIAFVERSPSNLQRHLFSIARIDLNTLEHSIIQLHAKPSGALLDVAPGFAAAIMWDLWNVQGVEHTSVHTLHTFNQKGQFSRRRSALTSGWPTHGWYEEPPR